MGIELVEKESAAYYDEIWNTRDYDLYLPAADEAPGCLMVS